MPFCSTSSQGISLLGPVKVALKGSKSCYYCFVYHMSHLIQSAISMPEKKQICSIDFIFALHC